MKRKIIQIAGSTHLVSVPKSWIVKHGVKKGDEVDVSEQYDKIVICTEDGEREEATTLDCSTMNMFVFRFLTAIYKSGYDKVELRLNDSDSLTNLSKQMNAMLPGFEIVDQQGNTVTIKNISRVIDTDFDILLRKIFLISKSLGNNTYEILKNNDYDKLDDALILEVTAARFCHFCQRLLNKKGYKESSKVTFIYSIVQELDKLKNQYRYLCTYLKKNKKTKIDEETLELFREANEFFASFYELFYKFEHEKVSKLAATREDIKERANKLFEKKTATPVLLHHTINIVDSTSNMLKAFLGMAV